MVSGVLHSYRSDWGLLGIGLLQQRTPELIVIFGVTVDKLSINCRQPVVDHHIHPLPKHPELKVEDSSIVLWVFRIPLLILVVGDYLESHII